MSIIGERAKTPANLVDFFWAGRKIKIEDFLTNMHQYTLTDPITKGTWIINSAIPLSEFGIQYAALDASMKDDVRPAPNGTITVNFSIKVEEESVQKSEAQKLLEALLLQH